MADTDAYIDPQALSAIQQRLESLTDFRPLMHRIGRTMKSDTQMNFRQGISPTGEKWAPLKIRKGQPLRDTGRLQNSIQFRSNDEEVVIGTNVKYAPTHQFGAVIRPKNGKRLRFIGSNGPVFAKQVTIPARPFIGLAQRQVNKINRQITRWVEEQAND